MNSGLFKNLSIAGAKAQYDTQCKKILSEKIILAWILKHVTTEFSDMSIEKIADCIENPQISLVKVGPGETNQASVVLHSELENDVKTVMTGVEDAVSDEGSIYYDILFSAYVPVKNAHIKLIINLESQKSFYPGYEIVTRGIFYCGRMLSAQLGTEFKAKDYDNLKKVYSIWICMNAPKYIGNAISEYSVKKNDIIPGIPDNPKAYDKISVVQICLNNKADTHNQLLGMLNTLLSPDISVAEKKKQLSEDYHINTENKLEKELNLMCNLSDLVEERGIEKGIEKGANKKLQELISKKLKKGQSLEVIADALEESVETIQKLINEMAAKTS